MANSPSTSPELNLKIGKIEESINVLKGYCSKPDIPFSLNSEMRSVVTVLENCLEQLKSCVTLVEELLNLEFYIKDGDKTKAMLLMFGYGGRKNLLEKATSAIRKLDRKKEDCKKYFKEVEKATLSPNYVCPECRGTGSEEVQKVFRERGSPPQLIIQLSPCNSCQGSGKKTFKPEVKETLILFSKKTKTVFGTLLHTLELMRNLSATSASTISNYDLKKTRKRT